MSSVLRGSVGGKEHQTQYAKYRLHKITIKIVQELKADCNHIRIC